jgi:hypothetical protein
MNWWSRFPVTNQQEDVTPHDFAQNVTPTKANRGAAK